MKNSKTLHALILTAGLIFIGASLASALTISIMPSKDNTLYEFDPNEGDVSNALGIHFFTGETVMGELRRGVLAFDIAGKHSARLNNHSREPEHEHVNDALRYRANHRVDPASNFGWLVLGDESTSATAKRLDTRESASPPVLTIEYTPRAMPTRGLVPHRRRGRSPSLFPVRKD